MIFLHIGKVYLRVYVGKCVRYRNLGAFERWAMVLIFTRTCPTMRTSTVGAERLTAFCSELRAFVRKIEMPVGVFATFFFLYSLFCGVLSGELRHSKDLGDEREKLRRGSYFYGFSVSA